MEEKLTHNAILLVGACGSGKTWVMSQLVAKLQANKRFKLGLFFFNTNGRVNIIGKYDGTMFQGSDRLSMGVMAEINRFIAATEGKLNLFEGDRFSNSTFIQAAKPFIVKIKDTGEAGRQRRGSTQTERHIKAINTRISKINANLEVGTSQQALDQLLNLISNE